jgi:hypothetical protein
VLVVGVVTVACVLLSESAAEQIPQLKTSINATRHPIPMRRLFLRDMNCCRIRDRGDGGFGGGCMGG